VLTLYALCFTLDRGATPALGAEVAPASCVTRYA
jgi:hypothetical protein